jgi:hypothetical protein
MRESQTAHEVFEVVDAQLTYGKKHVIAACHTPSADDGGKMLTVPEVTSDIGERATTTFLNPGSFQWRAKAKAAYVKASTKAEDRAKNTVSVKLPRTMQIMLRKAARAIFRSNSDLLRRTIKNPSTVAYKSVP